MALIVQRGASCVSAGVGGGTSVTLGAPVTIGNTVIVLMVCEGWDGSEHIDGAGWTDVGPVLARNAGEQVTRAAYQVATTTGATFSCSTPGGRKVSLYVYEVAGIVVDAAAIGLQSSAAAVRTLPALSASNPGAAGCLIGVWNNTHETFNTTQPVSGNGGAVLYGSCFIAGARIGAIAAEMEIAALALTQDIGITAHPVGGGNSWSGIDLLVEGHSGGGGGGGDTWIPPMDAIGY